MDVGWCACTGVRARGKCTREAMVTGAISSGALIKLDCWDNYSMHKEDYSDSGIGRMRTRE